MTYEQAHYTGQRFVIEENTNVESFVKITFAWENVVAIEERFDFSDEKDDRTKSVVTLDLGVEIIRLAIVASHKQLKKLHSEYWEAKNAEDLRHRIQGLRFQ